MRKSKISSSSFYARGMVENRQVIRSRSTRRARMIHARKNVCRPYGRGFSCTTFPNQERSIIMTRSMKRTVSNEKQQELAINPRNVFFLQSSFSAVNPNSAPVLDSSTTTVNPTSLVLEYSSTADSSQITIELSANGIEGEMALPVEDIGYLLDPEIPAPTPAEAAAKVEPAAADNAEAAAGANGQPNPDGEPASLKPIMNADLAEKLQADAMWPEEGLMLLNYEEEWLWNSKWFSNGQSRLWEMTDFGGMPTSGVYDEDPFATFDLWNLWDGKQDPKPRGDGGNGFGNYDWASAS